MLKHRFSLKLLFFILSVCSLYSCGGNDENIPDVSHIPMDIEIRRLEREFSQLSSAEEIETFLNQNPKLAEQYFQRSKYPNDSLLINQIEVFLNFEFNDTLFLNVEETFGDFVDLKREIENAFRRIKYYYPNFKPPKIYTMVTGFGSFGFGQDIFIGEDFLVLGLDFFAGEKAIYRPKDIPNYIQRRYNPEYIAPTITQFISSDFIDYEPSDYTMLGEMIMHGKSLYFMEKIFPAVPDSLLMGYTAQEVADSYANESVVWGHFIQNDLLYETNRFQKNKYIGESPRVNNIAYECPGRIGRWLGWQIVRSLAENDTSSLQTIMKIKSAEAVLKKSKYKPQQ